MQKTSFFWPAALASSQLVWMLCAKYAWPPSSSLLPYFEAALLGGTALSYLLCYLIPVMLGRDIATGRLRIPHWAELLTRAGLLFGAASSIFWIFTWAPLWLVVAAVGMLHCAKEGLCYWQASDSGCSPLGSFANGQASGN